MRTLGRGFSFVPMFILLILISMTFFTISAQEESEEDGIDLTGEIEFKSPKIEDIVEDEETKITITITNVGDIDCETQFLLEFMINGELLRTIHVDHLDSGVDYFWNITLVKNRLYGDRTYEFRVVIDGKDRIRETDEENNDIRYTAYVKSTRPLEYGLCFFYSVPILTISYVSLLLIIKYALKRDISRFPFVRTISWMAKGLINFDEE